MLYFRVEDCCKAMDNIFKILIYFIVHYLTRTSGCQISGYYGENCSLPCPQHCQEGQCDIIEGTCLSCSAGYSGPRCEEVCNTHTYGLGCLRFCGNCKNRDTCDPVNGSCPNGCMPGYSGVTCETGCSVGKYGINCPVLCSVNCKGICSHVTGHCEEGCLIGWKGPTCDTKCDGGGYGENCAKTCGFCYGNEQCHHIDGTCRNGCESGYWGDRCTRSIANGDLSVQKSTCHDSGPRSIVLYSFAALFFTSFVFNLIMVVKLRRSGMSKSGNLKGDNKARSTTMHPDRVFVSCPEEKKSKK